MDQSKLEAFVGRFVQDLAAGESAVATYLGDVLGLYHAMQVAGDYAEHDPDARTFESTAEHAAVLTDDQSPTYLMGVLEILAAMWASADRVAHAFRTGEGVDYADHDPD